MLECFVHLSSESDLTYLAEHPEWVVERHFRKGEIGKSGRAYTDDTVWIVAENVGAAVRIIDEAKNLNTDTELYGIEVNIAYYYQGQCNLEFTQLELTGIVRSEAYLTISCYEIE